MPVLEPPALDRLVKAARRAGTRQEAGWPRFLWWVGTVLLVTMVVHVALLVITGGPVSGTVSLRKPAAFAETGWLTAWSVALILPMLRTRAWQRHVVGGTVVLFGVGETAIMAVQAWRGVPSHYNFTTLLDAALMRGGAAGTAGVFLIGMIVLIVATARSRETVRSVRLGTSAGLVVLLVGCAVGLVMIFNNSGVYQGSVGAGFARQTSGYLGPDAATVGPQYLMVRPSTQGGDLLLLHAIGVHGLILLAVPSVLLARTAMTKAASSGSRPRPPPRSRSRWPSCSSRRFASFPWRSSTRWRSLPSPCPPSRWSALTPVSREPCWNGGGCRLGGNGARGGRVPSVM